MAQSFITDQGTLVIPGAYASYTVQTTSSGLATTGVLMLVGEAESGADFSLESDLQQNAFGPDQLQDVIAKYRSGPLVDAFRAAIAPMNDPAIVGSPNSIIMVKTNKSTKATLTLKQGGADYGIVADRNYGKAGNQIYVAVANATNETAPTTGAFTFIPPAEAADYAVFVNGKIATASTTINAATAPNSFVTQLNGLSVGTALTATGGVDRAAHPASGTAGVSVSGYNVTITTSAQLGTVSAGDTLVIPAGSALAGAGSANVGAYVVTAASANAISATKMSDAGKTGAAAGTITAPVAVAGTTNLSQAPASPASDLKVYSPVTVNVKATAADGTGRSLEIAQLTTGPDLLERCIKTSTGSDVSFISKSGAPKVLAAATERSVTVTASRTSDGVEQEVTAGGEIALKVGYEGSSATLSITNSQITITVSGGSGTSISTDLKDYATIGELAKWIDSQPGFSASAGSPIAIAQLPATALDDVSAVNCACKFKGAQTCRVKVDAYRLWKKMGEELVLVTLTDKDGNAQQPTKGLPDATASAPLSGGTKGGTTDAEVVAAIEALEKIQGNFLVPLFSNDALTDIADGLTDTSSTYTIEAINAAARSHVLKMSTLKRRKFRQAFLSFKGSFADAKDKAANVASFRCSMTFQDARDTGSNGSIQQFAPWCLAAKAAGGQAAGFYRSLVFKNVNVSGVLQAAKDFDDRNDTQVEEALLSGLLPVRRSSTGGFYFASDQTTYGKDSNFVFNSIQAIYVADVIALGTSTRMEKAFVGQSTADVSAGLVVSFLESTLDDYRRLKLIAASSDAPKGYKNLSVKINGSSMLVSFEVKLAGSIYFVPINFLISQVTQTA